MKISFTLFTSIISGLLIFSVPSLFSQPYQLEGDFGAGWTSSVLLDRGGTLGATVQASTTSGSINFLFNNALLNYNPKWCGSNAPDYYRPINTYLASAAYYYSSGGWDVNLQTAMTNLYYYTFVIGKNATGNNDMSILETMYEPATIISVSDNSNGSVIADSSVTVTVTLNQEKDTSENIFIRWTDNNWSSSNFIQITGFDTSFQGFAIIPGHSAPATIDYYVLSTNQTTLEHSTADYFTLNVNINGGLNYSYIVISGPTATITADSALTENRLDFRYLTLNLSGETFADATLLSSNFTLNNVPAGTTAESLSYIDSVKATLYLAFDGTDFDSDYTHFSVTISGTELTGGNNLTSNELTITAGTESIYEGIDNSVIVMDQGSGVIYYADTLFNALNLGIYNSSSTLTLKSGQLFVWKDINNGGDITACYMNYRIYKQGATPSSFTQVYLPWHSEWNVGENQLWWNDSPDETNLNLLSIANETGIWNIEVYFEAYHDSIVYYRNNNGNNYVAYFYYEAPASECPFEVNMGNDTVICGYGAIILDPAIRVSPYGDSLIITYNATQGQTELIGASKVYMHSGVELHPYGDWQYTTGNWGQDDGIGLMHEIGQDLWQITIEPVTYFNYPADSAVFGLFMKFRNEDGTLEGTDNSGNDIWINMSVEPPASSFNGVSVQSVPNLYNSILWSTGAHSLTITVNNNGSYWVNITDTAGCLSGDTINVSIHSLPLVEAGNDTIICTGDSVAYSLSGYEAYSWSDYETQEILGTDSLLYISEQGIYRVDATDSAGCTGFDIIIVSTEDPPVADFSYTQTGVLTVEFTDLSSNASTYSWDFNSDGTEDDNTPGNTSCTYNDTGQFNVTLVVSNTCSSDTAENLIYLLGINEINSESIFSIYPNPANNLINIKINETNFSEIRIKIFESSGQMVFDKSIHIKQNESFKVLDLGFLPEGVYTLMIISGKQQNSYTIVIQ
ncbi:MAG: T9SS type A sorting domain-containing protein [Bacteroidia bacterium]|nr:T9SS type A sorting domain-containing protein [Bacteroidia bacterium]